MNIKKLSIRENRLKELRESMIEQNNANICYIAMMSDIKLPNEEVNNDEMVRENTEFLSKETLDKGNG